MLLDTKHEDRLGRLATELRRAQTLTPELMSDIVTVACVRLAALRHTNQVARLNLMIELGAWTDAALTLVGLELPAWKLRRLVCEEGEWLCSLSKQPNLPADLDDTADANHEILPLAILSAFVEAKRRAFVCAGNSPTVPEIRPGSAISICCENFS